MIDFFRLNNLHVTKVDGYPQASQITEPHNISIGQFIRSQIHQRIQYSLYIVPADGADLFNVTSQIIDVDSLHCLGGGVEFFISAAKRLTLCSHLTFSQKKCRPGVL